MLILSVDPGGITGLAGNINGNYQVWMQPDRRELYDFIRDTPLDVVLCEQFITSNIHSHKWGIFTTEIVGGVEAVCYTRRIPFHRRTPNQRAPFVHFAIDELKRQGYKKKDDPDGHMTDALAHLIGWERINAAKALRTAGQTRESSS